MGFLPCETVHTIAARRGRLANRTGSG